MEKIVFLTSDDKEVVNRTPLFAGLPGRVIGQLLNEASVVNHPRKELLFFRGEPTRKFYIVLEGWVKIFRDTADGEQAVLAFRKPGESFAETAAFLGWNHPACAQVVSNARILEIPVAPFLKLLREDNEFALSMLRSVSQKLQRMNYKFEQIQAYSTIKRLANYLLELGDNGEDVAEIEIPFDKYLLAARLGMKPETLSRAILNLKDYGVIADGRSVTLSNLSRLREYCQVNYNQTCYSHIA